MYYLQSGFTQLGIYEGAGNKTTIPNLSRNRLSALSVPKPDETEQKKIAALLWKVQRAIEVEDKLTATARELKQATMRQLFSRGLCGEAQQETEIGPIPDSWSLRPLAELREFLQYGTSAKCEYAKLGNPVLRIPNILNGDIEAHDLKWCKLSAKEVDSWVLEQGDVIFIRTNGVRDRVGTCAVYHGQPERSLFASYLIRARLKTDKVNPDYFQYFSNTPVGRAQLAGRASPAADGKFNVNTKNIDAVLIPLPKELDEQREIVNILRVLDHKIRLHERKRATMQELFKALLHKLMTGEIRVADLDIDVSEVTQ
jgi:type I restriction enzyme S subunit